MTITRRNLLAAAATFAGAPLSRVAFAQEASSFPSKPVRIIMPYQAGVPFDVYLRGMAQQMTGDLGQAVVIENKPGAGANIGTEYVARAIADGYTLLAYGLNLAANGSLFKKINYDPVKDFTPVIGLIRNPGMLIVPADSPFKSVADLIAHAKAKPGSLSYSSGGVGSMAHFCGESLKSATGIQLLHIPYRGAPDVLNSLFAGETQLSFPVFPSALAQVKAGKLRGLAVTSPRRMPQLPDVPTMHEALGARGFDIEADNGIVAPIGTPRAIVARLYQAFAKVLADPNVSGPIVAAGYQVLGTKPEEVAQRIAKDISTYRDVVRVSGIQPE